MMNPKFLWLVAPLVLAYAACGDDRPGAGVIEGVGPPSGGSPGSSASSDASQMSIDALGPQVCEGTLQRGDEIPETAAVGAAPEPLGGAIEGGTYVLVEVTAYGASAPPPSEEPERLLPTGVKTKKTLFVTGNVMRTIGARSAPGAELPPETAEAWTFSPNGTSLDTRAVCPTRAMNVKKLPYSAVGSALALFVDATHREVYERR
jgi:hypothetical protein